MSHRTIGRLDLPSILFIRHTSDQIGDITGAGAGAGKKDNRRKWLGEGRDEASERARARAEQAARRPDIASAIEADEAEGRVLLSLGQAMSQSAFRWVCQHRQFNRKAKRWEWHTLEEHQRPSQTSIDEAAAVATAAAWIRLYRMRRLIVAWFGGPIAAAWFERAPENNHWARIVRHLARHAWRAARQSLISRADGMTGRKAESRGTVATVPLLHPSQADLASLQQAAQSGALSSLVSGAGRDVVKHVGAIDHARARVQRWAWWVLVSSWARDVAPEHRKAPPFIAKLKAARARACFVIRILHGDALADASKRAGFASPRAAVESLRAGEVWGQLERAASARQDSLPVVADLLAIESKHKRRAARAVRAFRAVSSGMAQAMGADSAPQAVALGIVSRALDKRAAALDSWKRARSRRIAAQKRAASAWSEAVNGWRAGFNR